MAACDKAVAANKSKHTRGKQMCRAGHRESQLVALLSTAHTPTNHIILCKQGIKKSHEWKIYFP